MTDEQAPLRLGAEPSSPVTPWSWAPPTRWRCLRCGDWFLTRDLRPRCPACGFVED